ncbi:MAG: AAA family ATPase [Deltaproteobacteria bacterium]|nr:AAA family ATPase [Deltaproteobacteria bacterium]
MPSKIADVSPLKLVSHTGEIKNEEAPENFLVSERVNMPLKEPEMIFPDLWPARTIALFTGDGGIGKTHWTLQLLVLLASGGRIDGTPFQASAPRPVVYISQEDEGHFLLGELFGQHPNVVAEGRALQSHIAAKVNRMPSVSDLYFNLEPVILRWRP